MAYHNGIDASNGDPQAQKWVSDQHNEKGSAETYNFLVDTLGYTEDSLASDGVKTSNPNHEQYEDQKECMWVRDTGASGGSCAIAVWTAHAYKASGDTSITSTGSEAQNAGAWWVNGFYASGNSPRVEIKIQGPCPEGDPINTDSTHWSSGTAGTGYILKDNLDYYSNDTGWDLVESCEYGAALKKAHGAQPGVGSS